VPIKFAGTSEKLDGLEVFDADRHAGRILGMGDIVALVEQVTAGVDMAAGQSSLPRSRVVPVLTSTTFWPSSSR